MLGKTLTFDVSKAIVRLERGLGGPDKESHVTARQEEGGHDARSVRTTAGSVLDKPDVTAKQAFAALRSYLAQQSQGVPTAIWQMSPGTSVSFNAGRGRTTRVQSWGCTYVRADGRQETASIGPAGHVEVGKSDVDFAEVYPRAIPVEEWVVDSADASKAVVMAGGYASETSGGPWLMSRDIKGVGIVGVWCSSWYLDGVGEIGVWR